MATYPWLAASEAVDREVDRERVTLLYQRAPVALLTVLVNSVLLGCFMAGAMRVGPLLLWVGGLWLVSAVRAALWRLYQSRAYEHPTARWELWFAAGAALNGVGWGVGTAWFQQADLLHSMAALFVAGGMIMGASLSSATSMRSFFAYTVPAALPAIAVMFAVGDAPHLVMGATSLLYCGAMMLMAHQGGHVIIDSIGLRLQNVALGQELGRRTRDRALRLQTLLDYSGVATIVADAESSRVVDASKNVESLFGASHEQLLGRTLIGSVDLPQLASRRGWNMFVASARSEGGHRTMVRLGMPLRQFEVSAAMRTLEDREYLLVVLTDVTEQRVLEAQLAEASLLASVGALSREIAQDIHDPLTAVLGGLRGAVHDLDAFDTVAIRELRRPLCDALEGAEQIHRSMIDLQKATMPPMGRNHAPPSSKPADEGPSAALRIMVIDDEPRVGRSLRRALQRHEVEVCDDPRRALERLVGGTPVDVVLCDLMMPGLSGADVYEALQERAPWIAESMVFVTAGALTDDVRAFVERVPNPVLPKPVSFDQLERAVQKASQRS